MSRGTRRGVLAGAAGGLAVAAAACGPGGGAGGDAPPAARTQPITIRFMSWRPNAMDRFEKKWQEWAGPRKITIEIERTMERNTKLTAGLAADQAPDATDSESGVDFKFIEAGHFMALDNLMARDKVSQDKGYGLTYAEKWRAKTYQLAYWVEPFGIYYNKAMLKRKGIPDPWEKRDKPGEWTLEEMVDVARRATNPGANEWGLDWATGFTDLGPFIWTQGATHYNYDPFTWTLEHPASVQAHTWMMDWVSKTRWNISGNPERAQMMEPWSGRALDNAGMTPFAYGKVAIHFRSVNDWSRMWPVVKDQFEWDMLPIPSINGKVGASFTAGHPVNMWTKTKHPDDVWEFLKFLIGDDFQGFMAQEQVLVPAKLNHQERFFRPPAQYPFQHAKVFADVFKKPHGISFRHFKTTENGTVYTEFRNKIFSGELGLTNGLKEASTRMNQDIDWGGGENPFKGLKLPVAPR
jgi:ABC-type glycerol-3-phosphate transport system substrate-binding protein